MGTYPHDLTKPALNCTHHVDAIDTPPIRSAQAVHTALTSLFKGKHVVEFGTRNGDGAICFAQVAKTFVAIEKSESYCKVNPVWGPMCPRGPRYGRSGAGDHFVGLGTGSVCREPNRQKTVSAVTRRHQLCYYPGQVLYLERAA